MAAVPPPVVPAVVPNADIHAVLAICGIATEAHRTLIIDNEGFTSLADFGLLSERMCMKWLSKWAVVRLRRVAFMLELCK
jgi:hypothetical protein